jgi:hypothetical protein
MNHFLNLNWLKMVHAVILATWVAGGAAAAAPSIDQKELVDVGFKELVATTKVQQDWVRSLAPGQIRAVQRTGKKYFIYPDAPNNRILVGGPNEFEAYMQLHPDTKLWGQGAGDKASSYRNKQNNAMQSATQRDLSNPYLGMTWGDLGF